MSDYTLQEHIDFLHLGERWACTFCGPINAAENVRKEIFTDEELDEIIGHAFRRRYAAMSNYKNHKNVYPKVKDNPRWDDIADPEWHYWVEMRERFVRYLEFRFKITIDPDHFQVAIIKTQHGTRHYCILTAAGELINPDPNLKGPIIETRSFIY